MLADKEKPAENTLCILKGFDAVWGHFRPAEPHVFLPVDGKARKRASAASALRRAAAFSNESPTKWVSFESFSYINIAEAGHAASRGRFPARR